MKSARPFFGPSTAVGALATVAMAVRLLVPSPVTMANNGDAYRLLCAIHADTGGPRWRFAVIRYRAEAGGSTCVEYPTLQAAPVEAISWIHRNVLGLAGVLDARELMFVYCVVTGVAIGAFFRLLSELAMALRIALTVALFVVLADATFADYAGSPYTETAALYGVPIFAVGGLALAAGRRPKLALLATWIGATLIVGAKTQTAPLVVPLALFVGLRRVEVEWLARRRWGRSSGARVLPALCALSLALTGLWALGGPSGGVPQEDVNVTNEITMTVMPLSGNATKAATDLGLPARFSTYSGTSWWSPHPLEKDPDYAAVAPKLTDSHMAAYFIRHPTMSAKVFAHGAPSYLSFRNTYIGTYEESAGHAPNKQEQRITAVTTVSRWLSWTGIAGIVLYWILCLTAAAFLARRASRASLARASAEIAIVAITCTIMQYLLSAFGDGNEVTKHLAVGLLTAALAPLWLAVGVAVSWRPGAPAVAAQGAMAHRRRPWREKSRPCPRTPRES